MDQGTINRVLGLVKCYTPPYVDQENLCMDILFESWSHRLEEPSIGFIKNRCTNKIRELKLDIRGRATKARELHQRNEQVDREIHDEVNMLTKCLNNTEKKVIWYKYYQELTLREISDTMKLSLLQVSETLQGALFKMREAAQ